jgi:hypothetical protein
MINHQGAYKIHKVEKVSVTTSEGSINLNELGGACLLHNAGDGAIYIDSKTGVSADSWELAKGEKPTTLFNGTIYYKGAAASTLKILVLKAI